MMKILLCDDHPVVSDGLHDVLTEIAGCQVVGTVSTARQIEPSVQHLSPDLLFLDLNMDGKNMVEKITVLKSLRPSLKIVVFTSYNLPTLVSRAFELGADAYLLKSSGRGDIVAAVSAVQKGKKHVGESVRLRASDREKWLGEKPFPEDGFAAIQKLTEREKEVFFLAVEGRTEQEIGQLLHLSTHTVHTHRKNLMRKLQLHSSADLVRFAGEKVGDAPH